MKITESASGKVVLFGEHAVVYGHPSIVAAIDKRLFVTITSRHSGSSRISERYDNRFIQSACDIFKSTFNVDFDEIRIQTRSEFEGISGLGSSGAVTVALIKALSRFFKIPLTQKELFDLCYQAVKKVQPKGSGIDIAAAVYGGVLLYKNKLVCPVGLSVNNLFSQLLVCSTGIKADSEKLLDTVSRFKNKEIVFDQMDNITNQAVVALEKNDWQQVGELMNQQHALLQTMGVSSEKIEKLVSSARASGTYGAKLSGGGGGDCIIVLVSPDKKEQVRESLIQNGGILVV